ncbi:Disintegrin and metalloproteinase domain containing protein 12, partial [Dissostichus eleginoides]
MLPSSSLLLWCRPRPESDIIRKHDLISNTQRAGHPDTLQFELQMRGQHFLFDLQKNHALLPKPPNIFLYLPNGTGVSLRSDPVRRRDILSETKYIELVLVVDHQEFLNYQKNNKTIIYRMLDVANQVDWFYRPLKVRVALTGLEIWSDSDKIPVEKSPTDTLNSFLRWRTQNLLPRLRHDNAQLVKGGSFDGTTVGMASQASMCSRDRSGGVNVPGIDECVVSPSPCGPPAASCCAVIGQECEDPCCNASTCRLVPGAQCSEAGSRCRDPLGECDLPEFCTGSSPYCPPNVFLQNGQRCEDEASYCYEGVCASMKSQCQLLWGPNATSAPPVCFSSVNKQGNKYGNCGKMKNGSYIPCGDADVQCGRIQCEGGRQRPLLGSNTEILTTTVRFNHSDLVCRGTFFHLGDDVSDPATVSQGTACSQNKACLNQKCQDVSVFGVEECRAKCNGHG